MADPYHVVDPGGFNARVGPYGHEGAAVETVAFGSVPSPTSAADPALPSGPRPQACL